MGWVCEVPPITIKARFHGTKQELDNVTEGEEDRPVDGEQADVVDGIRVGASFERYIILKLYVLLYYMIV